MALHRTGTIKTYTCLVSILVDVVVVLVLVAWDFATAAATEAVDDFDDVEVCEEDVVDTARFTFVTVTTVGNLAEQKLAASGTPARGFNRP